MSYHLHLGSTYPPIFEKTCLYQFAIEQMTQPYKKKSKLFFPSFAFQREHCAIPSSIITYIKFPSRMKIQGD